MINIEDFKRDKELVYIKKCNRCTNCVLESYGYSNYTVEGEYIHCSLKLHPEPPFDNWYDSDPRLLFAETCDKFNDGSPIEIDVDRECISDLTEEQKTKIKACGIDLYD